jgi:hypothetical protein
MNAGKGEMGIKKRGKYRRGRKDKEKKLRTEEKSEEK